jgi:hypothetical protein
MVLLVLGGVLFFAGGLMDWTFRLRLHDIGHRTALILGGAFNYAEYREVARRHRWPEWPVNLMWVLITSGIALMIVGFFLHFGTQPVRHPKVI